MRPLRIVEVQVGLVNPAVAKGANVLSALEILGKPGMVVHNFYPSY
jgi:hypothetical protein